MNPTVSQMESYSESLLDTDGSCRDINFGGLSWSGAAAILDWLITRSLSVLVDCQDDNPVESSVTGELLCKTAGRLGFCRLVLKDTDSLFSHLQTYLGADNGTPFLEVSFFPDDLILDRYSIDRFVGFLDNLAEIGGATQYFVRYENVSWRFGDTSENSGVIFTYSDIKRHA
jgi:hypothetical protein